MKYIQIILVFLYGPKAMHWRNMRRDLCRTNSWNSVRKAGLCGGGEAHASHLLFRVVMLTTNINKWEAMRARWYCLFTYSRVVYLFIYTFIYMLIYINKTLHYSIECFEIIYNYIVHFLNICVYFHGQLWFSKCIYSVLCSRYRVTLNIYLFSP